LFIPQISFDKNRHEMFGGITIGKSTRVGNKLLYESLNKRCKHSWKKIIGAHVTDGAVKNEIIFFKCR